MGNSAPSVQELKKDTYILEYKGVTLEYSILNPQVLLIFNTKEDLDNRLTLDSIYRTVLRFYSEKDDLAYSLSLDLPIMSQSLFDRMVDDLKDYSLTSLLDKFTYPKGTLFFDVTTLKRVYPAT